MVRIFATAFDRYAVAAFEVQALDYVLKPFGAKRLGQALDRVRQPILHCEARGDYVALHTADGCYVVNTSVEYLAERLSPESFVRIALRDEAT